MVTLLSLFFLGYVAYHFGRQGPLFGVIAGGLIVLLLKGVADGLSGKREKARAAPKSSPADGARQIRLVHNLIENHALILSDRKKQLLSIGGHGEEDETAWEREKQCFIDDVIKRELGAGYFIDEFSLSHYIDCKVDEFRTKYPQLAGRAIPLAEVTPLQYVAECARILRAAGWLTETTKASGEQGADIVAEKDGSRVVIQCKKYSSPVGNKAVQEVHAAREFYRAGFAAVVTTSDYTKAAQMLAQRHGVALLRHDELAHLESSLS